MIISKAPLRVSFLGGGTDYPEFFASHRGAVLGSSIDKYAYLTANRFYSRLFDYTIKISYRKTEVARSLDQIEHTPFRECLRHCGIDSDIELGYYADLPAFTGLGSSSTFTVALLLALHAHCGRYRSGLEVAYEAIHLERHVFGDRVGCQDQVLAAVGGLNRIEFRAEDNILVHRLEINNRRLAWLEQHLMVFFSGICRSASQVAARQIGKVGQNIPLLKRMASLVDRGCDLLLSERPLSGFGELLDESWRLKRSLDEGISNGLIDQCYEAARRAGALGGKLLGAGGGGFLLLFVPPERQAAVRRAMGGMLEIGIRLAAPGGHIIHAEKEPARERPAVGDWAIGDFDDASKTLHEIPVGHAG